MSDLPVHTALPAVADADFDEIAALTRRVLRVPVALVTLVDRTCQVFPGASGLSAELDASRTTPLRQSFCRYVVSSSAPLLVSDLRSSQELATHPAVAELGFVAYAGMPLLDASGDTFGSLCAIDARPHGWSDEDVINLRALAATCSRQFQLRTANARAAVDAERLRIAGNLHETVVRELFTLSMSLHRAHADSAGPARRQLESAIADLDEIVRNVRESVYTPDHSDAVT